MNPTIQLNTHRRAQASRCALVLGTLLLVGPLATLPSTAEAQEDELGLPDPEGSTPPIDEAGAPEAAEPEPEPAPDPEPSDEPAGSTDIIQRVDIQGLRRVGRETALSGVRSTKGTAIDTATITKDLRTLWATGFFKDIRIAKEPIPGGWRLVISVVEKPSIRSLAYVGYDDISEEDIKAVVDVRPFTILDTELLKRNVQKIKDLYVDKGYYLADVNYRTEPVDGNVQEVNVYFDIVENAKVMVKQITLIGNENIPDEDIKGVLQTREGSELSWLTQSGTYKEEFFQTDLFRIQALYYDKGYVNVKVGEPTATISRDRRFIYLSVPITEGEQFNIGRIGFSGDVELKNDAGEVIVNEEKLRERLSIKSDEIFSRTKLFEDIQRLTAVYRNQGYAYANVTPNSQVRGDVRLVDLDLEVERGPLVYIERIEVVGNTRTRDKVIRREMRIAEGELFKANLIERSRARIFQLGFFENVNITNSRGGAEDRMNLTIEIKERSTGTFQIGAGFSSVERFIATAQISQNNFLGRGQTLSLSAQLSFGDFARQLVTLQFFEPYFLDTKWSLGFNAFITQRFFRDFQNNASGFSPSLGYPLTPDLRISFSYTLERLEIETGVGGNSIALAGLDAEGRNSELSLTLSYDTRDNRLFPTKGQYHVARFDFSNEIFGTEDQLEFNRFTGFTRFFYPLPLGMVARFNASFGYAWVRDGRVPLSERFFPGGIFSIRGFPPRGLGPTIPTAQADDPSSPSVDFTIGGNKELIFNFEIEFPILKAAGIKGVVFADAGNAYNEDENFFYINTDDPPPAYVLGSRRPITPPLGLYYSVGFGFRWFSPIGPLRFEWGIPITKRNPDQNDILFEFTIGNFF